MIMGNSLTNSIVRGFGFTIGKRAANSLLNSSSYSSSSYDENPTKITNWQVVFAIILWIPLFGVVTKMGSMGGGLWFIFGLPICLMVFKIYNIRKVKAKQNEMAEFYLNEIPSLMEEVKALPLEFLITRDVINEDTPFEDIESAYEVLNRIVDKYRPLVAKYDREMVNKIGMGMYWVGMSEENLTDMKGYPTNVETKVDKSGITTKVYVYGNKQTGDILTFENGVLVTYTDR
jgi:hypothetical protein